MLSTRDEAQTLPDKTRTDVSGLPDSVEALTEVLDRIVASTAALDTVLGRVRMAAAVHEATRVHATTDVSGFVGGAVYDY